MKVLLIVEKSAFTNEAAEGPPFSKLAKPRCSPVDVKLYTKQSMKERWKTPSVRKEMA